MHKGVYQESSPILPLVINWCFCSNTCKWFLNSKNLVFKSFSFKHNKRHFIVTKLFSGNGSCVKVIWETLHSSLQAALLCPLRRLAWLLIRVVFSEQLITSVAVTSSSLQDSPHTHFQYHKCVSPLLKKAERPFIEDSLPKDWAKLFFPKSNHSQQH